MRGRFGNPSRRSLGLAAYFPTLHKRLASAHGSTKRSYAPTLKGSNILGLILLLIILVLLFGGGGFYLGPPFHYYGGGLSVLVIIVIVVLLFRS